ncbi:multidrug resistance protein, MATE family [Desulfonatronum zhilinae]|nr:multidrug resistance protein, MATE family [Desulfonatronum zhilinae]
MAETPLSHRDYLMIALPFIAATVTQPLLGAVDTAVVGHLDSPIYIGGVAIGTVILNTLYWLFGFFRVSTTSQSAIALGTGRGEDLAASLARPFCIAAGVGLAFILLQAPIWHTARVVMAPEPEVAEQARIYFTILIWGAPLVLLNYTVIGWLMGQARTRATLATQVTGNVVNIILDIALVTFWGFGVAGVAAASLAAQALMLALGLYFVSKTADLPVARFVAAVRMRGEDVRTIISANTDLLLRTVCLLTMFFLMTKVAASMGTNVLASNAVLLQVTFIVSYIFDGIANASSVFSGKSVGRRDEHLLRATMRRTTQWTGVVIVFLTLVLWLWGEGIGALFTDIPEVLVGYMTIQLWAVAFPLVAGFGLTFYGVFTGSGVTRPVRNSTFFALIVFLTGLAIFVSPWGNHGLWLSFLFFYVGRGAFLIPYLGAVRSKVGEKGEGCGMRPET